MATTKAKPSLDQNDRDRIMKLEINEKHILDDMKEIKELQDLKELKERIKKIELKMMGVITFKKIWLFLAGISGVALGGQFLIKFLMGFMK